MILATLSSSPARRGKTGSVVAHTSMGASSEARLSFKSVCTFVVPPPSPRISVSHFYAGIISEQISTEAASTTLRAENSGRVYLSDAFACSAACVCILPSRQVYCPVWILARDFRKVYSGNAVQWKPLTVSLLETDSIDTDCRCLDQRGLVDCWQSRQALSDARCSALPVCFFCFLFSSKP